MNNEQKELFIKLTHFLGQVLGKSYEVVFHIISKKGSYIAAIENSHISRRTIDSPLTAFASKLLQEKAYLKQDFLCHYKAQTKENKLLNGSTFFIKKGDKLVGILCINHDTSEIQKAVHKIIEIENLSGFGEITASLMSDSGDSSGLGESPQPQNAQISIENLSHNIEDILAQSIDLNYLKSGFTLSATQKNDIVKNLYQKGIFNIKGSLYIVAKLLKISEPSVYRYLNKLKKDENL